MSIKCNQLSLIPPSDGKEYEVFDFTDITCTTCSGSGKITIFEDYFQIEEPETETCQRCQGIGKLQAKVNIEWQACDTITE